MNTVLVLLSTYNGGKYLEEQLNSLMNQEDVEVNILVRDDGSTDNTQEILSRYASNNILTWYQGINIGWARSFMDLIYSAPTNYSYYAFCDQDDIWLPNKLKVAIQKLNTLSSEIKMYCSNLYNYRDGNIDGKVHAGNLNYDKYRSLVYCINYGCTCLFNIELLKIIQSNPPDIVFAHDYWVYQSAIFLGSVYYDSDAYILYRQHSQNQVGGTKSSMQTLKIRLRRMKTFFKQHEREIMANELLRCYKTLLSDKDINIIDAIAAYRKDFLSTIRLFFDTRYSFPSITNNFFFRLRIILHHI